MLCYSPTNGLIGSQSEQPDICSRSSSLAAATQPQHEGREDNFDLKQEEADFALLADERDDDDLNGGLIAFLRNHFDQSPHR